MHRKTREFPYGYVLTGLALLGLVVGLVATLAALAQPAYPSAWQGTSYLVPAMVSVSQMGN